MMKRAYIYLLLLLPLAGAGQNTRAWWRAVSAQEAEAPRPFVTTWDLSVSGSGATQLTFGVAVADTVAYTWEELSPGSATGSGTFSASPLTITGLPSGAVIRLSIGPENFQRIIINNGTDRSRLTRVDDWGTVEWTSMLNAFWGTNNVTTPGPLLPPKLGGVLDMRSMWRVSSWNNPINDWNTQGVTLMSNMFVSNSAFNQPLNLWDVSNVASMLNMFQSATAFNQNIGAWRPKKCTNFGGFMAGKTAANYSAANLAAIYSGWPQDTLQNGQTTSFNTIKYAASGAPGRAFLAGTAASVAVSDAVDNAGEIQITTSAAHGRTTGDFVFIDGVGGVPNSFGGWIVTVIDATNFTLDGSTFAGAYTSGGNVQTGRGWSITDGGPE